MQREELGGLIRFSGWFVGIGNFYGGDLLHRINLVLPNGQQFVALAVIKKDEAQGMTKKQRKSLKRWKLHMACLELEHCIEVWREKHAC